jgi:heme-based aerotactic transducer
MSKCPFHALFNNEKGMIQLFAKKRKIENEQQRTSLFNDDVSTTLTSYYKELIRSKEADKISFIGLTVEDVQNLTNARPIFEKYVEQIVDEFYKRVGEIPSLIAIIRKHSSIERLKQTLQRYLLDMVSGEIGQNYIERRKVIGNVHNRIKLFPEWYLSAYTIIQSEVLKVLTKELPPQESFIIFQSFLKLCSLDMQIAIHTYIDSYTSSMIKLNEIEGLQSRLGESSTTLAAAAEETTASILDREKNVRTILQEINNIQEESNVMTVKVEQGKKEVTYALSKLHDVVNLIEETQALTNELLDSSRKINEIVKAIRNISTQTNILSINANIEAARAGAYGKGFAVVASEVRKLAVQTEQSLDYIQGHISIVQETIQQFEAAFQQIVSETATFKEMNQNIRTILDQAVDTVKSSCSKVNAFASFIQDFQHAFAEISNASQQISEMAEQLNELSQELGEKFTEN